MSPVANGTINSVDTTDALLMDGVKGYIDWRDVPGSLVSVSSCFYSFSNNLSSFTQDQLFIINTLHTNNSGNWPLGSNNFCQRPC